MEKTAPQNRRKQTNLETANAMFKNAFIVKRTRFSKENPGLSNANLNKMTADYFRNLPDDNGAKGKL